MIIIYIFLNIIQKNNKFLKLIYKILKLKMISRVVLAYIYILIFGIFIPIYS